MKTIHTILREDFGKLDRDFIRRELLAEKGIHSVDCEPARNRLRIEYDPAILSASRLADVMCRYGVYPAPQAPTGPARPGST
jgi:hypothetical protein